ncbi:hypothetical protein ACLOJK_030846 [Asimina triloba]
MLTSTKGNYEKTGLHSRTTPKTKNENERAIGERVATGERGMSRVFGGCKALMAAASASASSAAKGSGTKKGASASAAAARNVGSGIQKAAPVSPAMSEFLGGVHEISRTDCAKKVWEHIKLHQLQNPANKKEICRDEKLKAIFGGKDRVNVEHFDRFAKEFGVVQDDDGGTELANNVPDNVNPKSQKPSKPADFEALFGGNDDDHFMIGIKFTKKSIKLYNDFYSSDVIVASPLGLITKIGEAEAEKEKDVDYLSSIEVLIIDHADVIVMQEFSATRTAESGNRFQLNCFLTDLVKLISEYKGILPKVLLQVRQVYERFDATSIAEADDVRLEYFSKKGGIMLFISSYFEFVRLRNFLKSQNASFCLLGEYTKPQDISRARVQFFEGRRKILLYTERAHFYRRYKIRGIKNLIVYSLPESRFNTVLNMLEGSENIECTVLFSRFDQLRLERIVGTNASQRMLSSKKDIFIFF